VADWKGLPGPRMARPFLTFRRVSSRTSRNDTFELFEKLTGHAFSRSDESEDPLLRIEANIKAALASLQKGSSIVG